jgi:LysM repeat protein
MFPRITIAVLVLALILGFSARPSGGAGPEHTYVVRPGDTLWSIAARTTAGDTRAGVWHLQQRNGLSTSTAVPGQRLVVP